MVIYITHWDGGLLVMDWWGKGMTSPLDREYYAGASMHVITHTPNRSPTNPILTQLYYTYYKGAVDKLFKRDYGKIYEYSPKLTIRCV